MNMNRCFLKLTIAIILAGITAFPVIGERPKIYWGTHRATSWGGIWRMNPDGSEPELLVQGADPWGSPEEGEVSTVFCMAIDNVNRHIYFGEVWPNDALRRVNMDGSGLTNLWSGRTYAVALDIPNGHVYFSTADALRRANFDMSGLETLVSVTANGIALDVKNGHLYYTTGDTVNRANLDGSKQTVLVDNTPAPRGIGLDLPKGKMYWATNHDGTGSTWLRATVQRANLDGTEVEILLKGDNANVEAPMTDYLSNPRDIVLCLSERVFYVSGVRIVRAAMDGSGSESVFRDDGGSIVSPYGLDLYTPLPEPTVILIR